MVLLVEQMLLTCCSSVSFVSKGKFNSFSLWFADKFDTDTEDWKPNFETAEMIRCSRCKASWDSMDFCRTVRVKSFKSGKRLFRDLSEFNSKLAEHRTSVPAIQSQIARTHDIFANGGTRLLFDSERSLKSFPSLLSDLPQTIFYKYLTVLYCIHDVRGSWQANEL